MATAAMLTAAVPPFPVGRLSVDQYERMIAAGILTGADAVELINGWLVPKMPHGDDHDTAIENLTPLLGTLTPAGAVLRCQCALTLPVSVPEPDFVICTPARSRGGKHPKPVDVFLIIEVSDTSLRYDQTTKLELYARAGIPVYWVVNLPDRRVEVYTDPDTTPGADPLYRTRADYGPGQAIPVVVAGVAVGTIPVDAILP